MKFDLSKGLPESVLAKVRKHTDGTKELRSRTLACHYCQHKAIVVYEDSRGHVQTKCKKCGKESVYNVVLRRNGTIVFRRIITPALKYCNLHSAQGCRVALCCPTWNCDVLLPT